MRDRHAEQPAREAALDRGERAPGGQRREQDPEADDQDREGEADGDSDDQRDEVGEAERERDQQVDEVQPRLRPSPPLRRPEMASRSRSGP